MEKRHWDLEKKLASSHVPQEEQKGTVYATEKAQYMRLKRHKIRVDDFELLTIIGRGAFGEAHPWFKDVVWDKLYEMEAAFKPEVKDELDTRNFLKFDETDTPARIGSGHTRKMLMTSKDLNFVGYTYKNFDTVKGLHEMKIHHRGDHLIPSLVIP